MIFFAFVFIVILAYTFLYISLRLFLPWFFEVKRQKFGVETLVSLAVILSFVFFTLVVANIVIGGELGNRIQHAFAGGFAAYMTYFFALKDSKIKLPFLKIAVFGFFLVTTLGVLNELAEFSAQHFLGLTFATTIEDTWLDLASNTFGILISIFSTRVREYI